MDCRNGKVNVFRAPSPAASSSCSVTPSWMPEISMPGFAGEQNTDFVRIVRDHGAAQPSLCAHGKGPATLHLAGT
jgi:hypothetical protein